MAKGDTKTNQYLDIAANGTRADLPTDTCCETRSQTLIREVAERIMDVEDEVERLENNPDVADIVATYADLQSYDTSQLTDKDVIRVLQDETHDGDSTYYRWSTTTNTWAYIGESKQYTDFVGTDGTTGGQNGLVPAPVATDAGKFLNANGSWEEVQAGGATELTSADYNWPTANPDGVALWSLDSGWYTAPGCMVYPKSGTSIGFPSDSAALIYVNKAQQATDFSSITIIGSGGEVDVYSSRLLDGYSSSDPTRTVSVVSGTGASSSRVMSQSATTNMVFADANTKAKIQIGNNAVTSGAGATSIGGATRGTGDYSVAIGNTTRATGANSVALGSGADASQKGQFDISTSFGGSTLGYNGTQYRLLTGLYDGQSAHDAATKGQLDSIAIRGAGAPTTSTVGEVGQLYEDGTNGALYQLKSIDITVTPNTYNWVEVGAGGGGPTVVQTTGTSTTDVMSQNAVTGMIFNDPGSYSNVAIGTGASTSAYNNVVLGRNARGGSSTVAIGGGAASSSSARASGNYAVAIGADSEASGSHSIALGRGSRATAQGQFDISTRSNYGYNNSNYRLLSGVYDGQSAHDAATVGQITPLTGSAAPTTDTVGTLGKIYIDTSTATAYMCVAADTATPSYTWKQITA